MDTLKPYPDYISQSLTWTEYRALIAQLLSINLTTGNDTREVMVEYTRLNQQRMNRWDKKGELLPAMFDAISSLNRNLTWLVLTEGWCGDAAQNIPWLAKMAEASNGKIKLQLILRDEHPELMEAYLTNGGKSIPKLICLTDSFQVTGTWGPRPASPQKMVLDHKNNPVVSSDEFVRNLHTWYLLNEGKEIQQEYMELLHQWSE